MVLGTAGANEQGELYLSAPAKARCDRAAEVYYGKGFSRGVEGSFLITGGYGKSIFDTPPINREAQVMAEYLIRQYRMPESIFLLESESTTTRENFDFSVNDYPEFFADIESGERKLALISDKDHLDRALRIGAGAINCYERQLVTYATHGTGRILEFPSRVPEQSSPLAADS